MNITQTPRSSETPARRNRGVWAITAYEDLVELGHLDAAGLQLLFELARQEAHRFPSLAPPEGWTADALWDLAHDFFVDRGARVTTMLLAQASDEASIGRLLRRLGELLCDDPAVERVRAGEPGAGWWRLAGTSAAPWGGRFEDLVAAANGVPGIRLDRKSSSTRRNPIAERQSLLDIVHAVLAAADGCLDLRQLVAVFTRRFPTAVEWGDAPMSQKVEAAASAPAEDLPEVQVLVNEQGREVYDQLTPRERALVPHLAKSVEEHMAILECGRSQAYLHAARLKQTLQTLLDGDDHRDDIMLEVCRLCVVSP